MTKKLGRPRAEAAPTSEGNAQLRRYLQAQEMTQEQLAQRFGIPRGQLSHYLVGTRTPSIRQALNIQNCSGGAVRVESWAQAPEGSG